MAKIETLVDDIYALLDGKNPVDDLPDSLYDKWRDRMHTLVETRLQGFSSEYEAFLRISNIGKPCIRQLWLQMREPDKIESLEPFTKLKFLYGDVIEELLLFLAEAAGHTVEGCQDRIEVEGVVGHRDAVIDGVLIDVKSASTYSFNKFARGELVGNDPFGYIGQIQTYLEGSQDDPIVTDKGRCGFLVMDKTLGHICLDLHDKVDFDVRGLTKTKVKIIESDEMPDRAFKAVPDGAKGNMKLPMECSYCNAKHTCWPRLRTFKYSNGPRYLTEVKVLPNVPEIV